MNTPFTLSSYLFLLLPSIAAAQTLDQSNLTPPLATPFALYFVDYQTPGPAGADLTWDFSNLPDTSTASTSFSTTEGNPSASSYAGANLVEDLGEGFNDFYSYTAAGIDYHGMANPSYSVLMVYQDPQRLMTFPCTLGTTWQDVYGGPWTSSTGVPAHSYGSVSGTADATGTLIMPYGTLQNVLRVTTTWHDSDYFMGYGYINYNMEIQDYYKPGIPRPLLSFRNQTGGGPAVSQPMDFSMGSWLSASSMAVQEAVGNTIGMDLLPNPAHGTASLLFSSTGNAVQLGLLDATGRMVRNMTLDRQPQGIAKQELNLSGLPPGLYTVQLTAANGQRGMKKLAVE